MFPRKESGHVKALLAILWSVGIRAKLNPGCAQPLKIYFCIKFLCTTLYTHSYHQIAFDDNNVMELQGPCICLELVDTSFIQSTVYGAGSRGLSRIVCDGSCKFEFSVCKARRLPKWNGISPLREKREHCQKRSRWRGPWFGCVATTLNLLPLSLLPLGSSPTTILRTFTREIKTPVYLTPPCTVLEGRVCRRLRTTRWVCSPALLCNKKTDPTQIRGSPVALTQHRRSIRLH